ncbi:hypothetical protein MHH84_11060 [Bacillus sp. FSL K6-1109]|uniref:hypothetical protein n=1 Tax=Bacillus TaxID=1386 RepID=UPI0001F4445B|nr:MULTISPECIES: hypothetical protein [Bacillus]AMR10768.1 hypothetical protein AB684_11450 [Bacillus licheniformis]EFV72316.1 hypothetical protein HMPREF1012_01033 [Bacillus sp. BT1B_CT2]KJH58711.1 hypothetical protein UF14_09890 [Bacillus licheniformis]KYC83522.1 hypothetical protein B4091_2100 [Bacillus licheniformis]MCM3374180.1 hypothetical protein [Bacillus licheniformis]
MNFAEQVEELNNEELREAFFEIQEFRKTGVLKIDGIYRRVVEEYEKETGQEIFSPPSMREFFLFEMAKRAYMKE